jgi:hypothetical protein
MKHSEYSGYALSWCVAAALLAGCGGSQSPIAARGAVPQRSAIATHADRGGSWMLPEAKSEDLLYASIETTCCVPGSGDVYVFSYPQGKLVGELSVAGKAIMPGLCSDDEGDVFVTGFDYPSSGSGSEVYEYQHGQTTPIAELSDPWAATACSVDPVTGNLAVANYYNGTTSSPVLVYNLKTGKYTAYYDNPPIAYFRWCAYDGKGDLYVDGRTQTSGRVSLGVLPKGQASFSSVTLNEPDFNPYSLQWHDNNLVIAGYETKRGPESLVEVRVKRSEGTIVGTIALRDFGHKWGDDGQVLIKRKNIISGGYPAYYLHVWRFPQGGYPLRRIARTPDGSWYGVAISAVTR